MKNGIELVSLILVHPKNSDSWMFHETNVMLSKLQAKAIDLSLTIVNTVGRKEEELQDLERCLAHLKSSSKVEAIVSGAIASKYQKDRIDRLCDKFGIKSITPLWGIDQANLVEEEIRAGFKIIITSYKALGFDKNWLGRMMTLKCYDDLIVLNEKYGVNIAGEGGEYETFVIDGPFFKKRIRISELEKKSSDYSGHIIIKNARLEEKN